MRPWRSRRGVLGLVALVAVTLLALQVWEEATTNKPEALSVDNSGKPWHVAAGGTSTASIVLTNAGTEAIEATVWVAPLGEEASWLSFSPEMRRVTVAPETRLEVEFDVHTLVDAKGAPGEAELIVSWIEKGHRFTDRQLILVTTEAVAVEPQPPHQAVLEMAAIGAFVGGSVAWLMRLEWRRLYGACAAVLYSRIERSEALENENRRKVMDAITSAPGIHFSELRRQTGLSNGSLYHHLRILAENGLVTSHRQHGRRLYAPTGSGFAPPEDATPAERRILDLLPPGGLTQAELARQLGITRQGVGYHVQNLERQGLLRRQIVEGSWRYLRTDLA